MLFVFERYKHNDNKVSASENLSFLSIILFIIIISLKFIVKNLNEESFDVNSLKDIKKKINIDSQSIQEKDDLKI